MCESKWLVDHQGLEAATTSLHSRRHLAACSLTLDGWQCSCKRCPLVLLDPKHLNTDSSNAGRPSCEGKGSKGSMGSTCLKTNKSG